ncbi:MAG: hypothetical protein ACRDHF_01610 [Tepidiformaceae bacterium]
MRPPIRIVAATIAVTAALAAPGRARAQGTPEGSTLVAGVADSLFGHFLSFLRTHGDSATSVDSRGRAVVAKVQGVDEPVIFTFVSRGDSTAITARGALARLRRGGGARSFL